MNLPTPPTVKVGLAMELDVTTFTLTPLALPPLPAPLQSPNSSRTRQIITTITPKCFAFANSWLAFRHAAALAPTTAPANPLFAPQQHPYGPPGMDALDPLDLSIHPYEPLAPAPAPSSPEPLGWLLARSAHIVLPFALLDAATRTYGRSPGAWAEALLRRLFPGARDVGLAPPFLRVTYGGPVLVPRRHPLTVGGAPVRVRVGPALFGAVEEGGWRRARGPAALGEVDLSAREDGVVEEEVLGELVAYLAWSGVGVLSVCSVATWWVVVVEAGTALEDVPVRAFGKMVRVRFEGGGDAGHDGREAAERYEPYGNRHDRWQMERHRVLIGGDRRLAPPITRVGDKIYAERRETEWCEGVVVTVGVARNGGGEYVWHAWFVIESGKALDERAIGRSVVDAKGELLGVFAFVDQDNVYACSGLVA